MPSHPKFPTKTSKPRISFVDKSVSYKNKHFQDGDVESTNEPDFVSWFTSKKESDSESTSVPIIRERLSSGYRIIDLRLDHVKDTLKLIRKHCILTDPLCCSIGLNVDSVSLQMLDYILLKKIADWCSFCAIEEGSGKVVGVIIGSLKQKDDQERTETRIRPGQGPSLFYLMTLNSCLVSKSQIYEKLNVANYFRIYVLCVETRHRGRGIGLALVRNFIDKCKESGSSACILCTNSGAASTIGRRLGFNCLKVISFGDALIPGDKDPFEDNSVKKYKLSCLALSIELPPASRIPSGDDSILKKVEKNKKKQKKR